MTILTNLNLSQNELQNAVLHRLAAAPENPAIGQIYFDTTKGQGFMYKENGWEDLGISAEQLEKLNGIETGADKALYTEMPTATADIAGQVVIYAGNDTTDYTKGLIYVCKEVDGAYIWEEATPTITGATTDSAEVIVNDGEITANVRISADSNNALQLKTVDGVQGLYVEATEVGSASETEDGLMTSDDKKKLDGIEEGAQVNKLEGVKVNGTALTIDAEKNVNVEISAKDNSTEVTTTEGKVTVGVKLSATEGNALTLTEDGLSVIIPEVEVPEYSVVKAETAEEGYIATYHLTKDGTNVGASINIPKDFLVKDASVEEVTVEGQPYAEAKIGDKYLDFVINVKAGTEEAESHIYLPVNELVDVYTAGNGIDISAANVVSAKVVAENGLSVDENGIKLALATEDAAGAMSKEDKAKLNAIAEGAQVNTLEGVQFNGTDLTIDENKKVNVVIAEATTTAAGLMSAADKTALDAAVTKNGEQDTAIAGINEKITALETKDGQIDTAIEGLTAKDEELAGKITALETKDTELVAKDTELEGKITANTEAIAIKQDKLVAGTNITIGEDGKTINANIPTASAETLGGIKVGEGLTIDAETGVLSVGEGIKADTVDWAGVENKPSTLGTETAPAGTYTKLTIDKYGLVTAGENLVADDIPDLSETYINVDQKGVANGVATLDANAKVTFEQLPDSILGNVRYGGTFGADGVCSLVDNKIVDIEGTEVTSLTIADDNAENYKGYYFIATEDATVADIEFLVGDWCISNGAAGWAKIDNTDAVMGIKGDKEDTYRIGQVNITAANVGAVEANEAITGGTFAKVTVDEKGLVTAGEEKITMADISDINDLATTYVSLNQGTDNANKAVVTDENGNVTTIARKFVASIGDDTATSYTVNHKLGSRDVMVQINDATTYEVVMAGITITDENNITVRFESAPAANAYRVIIIA